MLVQRKYIIKVNGEVYYSNTLRGALNCIERHTFESYTTPLQITIERDLKDLPE